jgi:hypothetical protein
MDKKKLDNFQEAMKPMINQNLEGLLYDLDLLPEQLNTECDGKRYSAIINMKELIESLKCCGNCGWHKDTTCLHPEDNCEPFNKLFNWTPKAVG